MQQSVAVKMTPDIEALMGVTVRLATLMDIEAIIDFYCRLWQIAYRDIINAGYLTAMSQNSALQESIHNMLLPWRQDVKVLLAFSGPAIVGLAAGGPYRSALEPGHAENYALYVDPAFQGRGLGQRLWQERARLLAADGATTLHTWVLEPNTHAQELYRAWGAQPAIPWQRQAQFGQQTMNEVHYVWDLRAPGVLRFDAE